MAIFHGRDLLSSKYITAVICDAANTLHFVALKRLIGDYFFVVIDEQLYGFKIDGARIMQYRPKLGKVFHVLFYNTAHYLPIGNEVKELEITLFKNKIRRVDAMLFSILKILGKKESITDVQNFTPHEIKKILDKLAEKQDSYSAEIRNMLNYLDHLDIDKIVTPVRSISDFLEQDLIATDPKFMGVVASLAERSDKGHQIISNVPQGPKTELLKIGLIIAMIAFMGLIVFYGYDQGWFNDLTAPFEGLQGISINQFQPGPDTSNPNYWMNNYTPEELKRAVNNGEVNYDVLPSEIQAMVDETELPGDE